MRNTHTWYSNNYPKANGKELTPYKLGFYKDLVDVENYEQFYSSIKKGLRERKKELIFKIENYDKDVYDVEKAINKAGKNGIFNYSFEYVTNEELLIEGSDDDQYLQILINWQRKFTVVLLNLIAIFQ